jgi:DNA-directed RNA polymerase sigma subunit (sigma70/sigma32)
MEDVGLYLRQIGRVPVLTPHEERASFRQLHAAREQGHVEEVRDLKRRLTEANLRLVVCRPERDVRSPTVPPPGPY